MGLKTVGQKRKISFRERATWGRCPVCNAKGGIWCDPTCEEAEIDRQGGGHKARIHNAPNIVKVIAADAKPKSA